MISEAVEQASLRKQALRAELLGGATATVGLQIARTVLVLLTGLVLARALGPAGYGTYAYILCLASVLAVPTQAGLLQLVVRDTAKAQINEDWGLMRGLWRWVTCVSLLWSLFVALATGGVAWLFADHIGTRQLATLVWGVFLVPLMALGDQRGAALRGLGKLVQGQLPQFVLRPGLLIVLVALPFWGTNDLTADRAMALHVLAATAAFAAGIWLLTVSQPRPLSRRRILPVYENRKWIASALPLAFVGGVYVINTQIDILILGLFEGPEQVGIYRVAVQGATLVAFGLTAINIVVAPQLARLYANADMVRLQKVATTSGRIGLLLAIPVVMMFLSFGKLILGNLFGASYITGYAPLAILAMGQLGNVAFGSVALVLYMTGHENITARTGGLTAIGNVVLNIALIPGFGVNGAAVATAITTFLLGFLLWRSMHRQLAFESAAIAPLSVWFRIKWRFDS